jgi:uncharacterized protein
MMKHLLKLVILSALLLYLVAAAAMFVLQRGFQYHPENKGMTPESAGFAGATVETLVTPDGERLVLWYAAPAPGKPTILYLHGNAGEIGDRPLRFKAYQTAGYGVAYLSYRGFGGSTGTISEPGLITDALTAYDWLLPRVTGPGQIALVGESLGTGVAVQLAAQRPVGAVALEAPYTPTADIAARSYWWLPVRLLMLDQFRSIDHIRSVTAPLLVTHGDADVLIPIDYGQRLFAAANDPKEFIVAKGLGHDALFEPSTWAGELAFFARHIVP